MAAHTAAQPLFSPLHGRAQIYGAVRMEELREANTGVVKRVIVN